VDGCDLYYEDVGAGVPILLIHPPGATASTWGPAVEQLARIGRVITYDRRGYARSGGAPVRSVSRHTADSAALLEHVGAAPAIVFGMSSGATITVDLAVRRPDLVRAVVEHEAPWRMTRHLPPLSRVPALARIGWLSIIGRQGDAADLLLRSAYAYRELRSFARVITHDHRGVGLSSRDVGLPTLQTRVSDLVTVLNAIGVRRPALLGFLSTGAVHVMTAAMPVGRQAVGVRVSPSWNPSDHSLDEGRVLSRQARTSSTSEQVGAPGRSTCITATRDPHPVAVTRWSGSQD
jgi:pimeloyl-ACP methyl ester carboxylesterase